MGKKKIQGIPDSVFILSYNSEKPTIPQLIRTNTDSKAGSYRLSGHFDEAVHGQFKLVLSLIKGKILPNSLEKLRTIGLSVNLSNEYFAGPSTGLALLLAALSQLAHLPILAPIAATGVLDKRGNVRSVSYLKEKLTSAYENGIQIVLVPHENLDDVKRILREDPDLDYLKIIAVKTVIEASLALYNISKYGIVDENVGK